VTDRRKDYGPTGCVERSFSLLLGLAWIVAVWFLSRPS
jgi:hypothetical protein